MSFTVGGTRDLTRGLIMDSENVYEAWVDGHCVTFRRGRGWICNCDAFRANGECGHAIKAAALLTWGRPMTPHDDAHCQQSIEKH